MDCAHRAVGAEGALAGTHAQAGAAAQVGNRVGGLFVGDHLDFGAGDVFALADDLALIFVVLNLGDDGIEALGALTV